MAAKHVGMVTLSKLPVHLTEFIGRQRERNQVARLLVDPACHLLTVVGSGGIGKTRLAVAAAQEAQTAFSDGVFFVSLQAVQNGEFLISTIADTLGLALSGQDNPLLQLGNYLAEKSLLLVLDNFEQLLQDAVMLTQILQMAPQVKFLVTSRERLNLRGEWVYSLTGLPVPASDTMEAWQGCDSVVLFAARARQVQRDFSLAADADSVIKICRLTEGLPLALELAASWLQTLTCAEIVHEIQQNLDFLATPLRDVPERQRSMRIIFTYAWQRLSPEEQRVFARLSVFQGGCQREAAIAVAAATLPILTSLVDKSLLRLESNGRYQIHELLRQFAAEQLASTPDILQETRTQHAHTFSRFLHDRFVPMTSGEQKTAMMEVGSELNNIRAAWQWAVEQKDASALEDAATALHTFYQYQGRFLEGASLFHAAVAALEQAPVTVARDCALAKLLTCASWLEMRFGRIAESTQMAETAVALYDSLGQLPPPGAGTDPLTPLSLLAIIRGDNEKGKELGWQAWRQAELRKDQQNMTYAGYSLLSAALKENDLEAALQIAQETAKAARHAGNYWFLASIYNHLGIIMYQQGNLEAARQYYQSGYNIRETFADTSGMATARGLIAEIAMEEGDFEAAVQLYQENLVVYQENGDRGGLVQTFLGLGVVTSRMGNDDKYYTCLWHALNEVHKTELTALTLEVLTALGLYLTKQYFKEGWGTAVLQFVYHHPLCSPTMQEQIVPALSVKEVAEEQSFSFTADTTVDNVVHWLQATLPAPQTKTAFAKRTAVTTFSQTSVTDSSQILIDPLSERELEVLHLISTGLKNREIADELTVALSTVKTHVNNIYGKLGVSSRVQAVARAQELNLL